MTVITKRAVTVLTVVIAVNVLAVLVNLIFAFLPDTRTTMHLGVAAASCFAIAIALFLRRELKKEIT